MRVFDYVVFYTPSEEDKKAGKKAAIIIEDRILEKDQKTAEFKVTRLIPEKWDEVSDQLTIAIRPF